MTYFQVKKWRCVRVPNPNSNPNRNPNSNRNFNPNPNRNFNRNSNFDPNHQVVLNIGHINDIHLNKNGVVE